MSAQILSLNQVRQREGIRNRSPRITPLNQRRFARIGCFFAFAVGVLVGRAL